MSESAESFMFLVPKYYFVTGGAATSDISPLNAFDNALLKAGIAQCNLVPVSSIIPGDAVEIKPIKIPAGTITFVVMARTDGQNGETIGAGVGWGFARNPETGERYGFVAEAHGYRDKHSLKLDLERKLQEMARARKMILESTYTRVESLKVLDAIYGSTVAVFVYVFDKIPFRTNNNR